MKAMSNSKVQMFAMARVYLEGWHARAELQEVIETMNRVEEANKQSMEAVKTAVQHQPFNPDWNNFHDGVAVGRATAFKEIADKIAAMPFNDATIDSLLIWLKEQK